MEETFRRKTTGERLGSTLMGATKGGVVTGLLGGTVAAIAGFMVASGMPEGEELIEAFDQYKDDLGDIVKDIAETDGLTEAQQEKISSLQKAVSKLNPAEHSISDYTDIYIDIYNSSNEITNARDVADSVRDKVDLAHGSANKIRALFDEGVESLPKHDLWNDLLEKLYIPRGDSIEYAAEHMDNVKSYTPLATGTAGAVGAGAVGATLGAGAGWGDKIKAERAARDQDLGIG